MSTAPLAPGATLGVFGGGQLGRMFAQAAARLGYRVHVFAPESDPPAAQSAAHHTRAAYDDLDAVRAFARGVDAVTYEFENVPETTMAAVAESVPVRPDPAVLATARHRIKEKSFLRDHGIPVTPFLKVTAPVDLPGAACDLGGPVVLKTTELGYDGKGQMTYSPDDEPGAAWRALGDPAELIVEQRIDLAGECSVLVARDTGGGTVYYGPFHNVHRRHILDVTTWSADDDSPVAQAARRIGQQTAEALELTGLLCIECFIARDGAVLVNELAPRPHNSGHLTIEACSISQFEQQARLTAGQRAVAPAPRAPAAAMANLLGDGWERGEPDWESVLNDPAVTLHLYGKTEPRVGRKMGHLTALADTPEAARERVVAARRRWARASG
jgi:5-(carboxyamino)imidazole ribonucleotide synthase